MWKIGELLKCSPWLASPLMIWGYRCYAVNYNTLLTWRLSTVYISKFNYWWQQIQQRLAIWISKRLKNWVDWVVPYCVAMELWLSLVLLWYYNPYLLCYEVAKMYLNPIIYLCWYVGLNFNIELSCLVSITRETSLTGNIPVPKNPSFRVCILSLVTFITSIMLSVSTSVKVRNGFSFKDIPLNLEHFTFIANCRRSEFLLSVLWRFVHCIFKRWLSSLNVNYGCQQAAGSKYIETNTEWYLLISLCQKVRDGCWHLIAETPIKLSYPKWPLTQTRNCLKQRLSSWPYNFIQYLTINHVLDHRAQRSITL